MSYMLNGVIIPAPMQDTSRLTFSNHPAFDTLSIDENCTIIASKGRAAPQASTWESLIRDCCSRFDPVLVVYWNDQVGVRKSQLYSRNVTREFGENDEVYVELDNDGFPMLNGKLYSLSDVLACDDEREFETHTNAIELGCQASGFCRPEAMMSFIRMQR